MKVRIYSFVCLMQIIAGSLTNVKSKSVHLAAKVKCKACTRMSKAIYNLLSMRQRSDVLKELIWDCIEWRSKLGRARVLYK